MNSTYETPGSYGTSVACLRIGSTNLFSISSLFWLHYHYQHHHLSFHCCSSGHALDPHRREDQISIQNNEIEYWSYWHCSKWQRGWGVPITHHTDFFSSYHASRKNKISITLRSILLSFDLRKSEVEEREERAISWCHNYIFLML